MGKNKGKRSQRTEFSLWESTMAKLDNEVRAEKERVAAAKAAKKRKESADQ